MYPKTFFEQTQPKSENGECFIMIPFADRFREVYDAIVEALEGPEVNFSCTRADSLFGGGHIIEDILRCIGKAEIIIADVTTKNPNVFYELGIAHMVKDVKKVLILTQDMQDIPFDLRQFRYISYEQNQAGIKHLQRQLISTVKEISETVYRFSMREDEQYKFPHRLFDSDIRCFLHFEITELSVAQNAAKFLMTQYVTVADPKMHNLDAIIGSGPGLIESTSHHALGRGENVKLAGFPWQLVLEEANDNTHTAHFRLVPKK
jgi:hypothetical protein